MFCFNFKIYEEFWKEVERWNNILFTILKGREQNTGNEAGSSHLEAAIKKRYDKTNGNIIFVMNIIYGKEFLQVENSNSIKPFTFDQLICFIHILYFFVLFNFSK